MAILAQEFPIYQPAMRIISNITAANPAVITTTFDHQYITGTIVRFYIMPGYGMNKLNQQTAAITVLSDTTFSVDIDTSLYEPYNATPSYPDDQQYCQVVPVGEINSILTAATNNVLPY